MGKSAEEDLSGGPVSGTVGHVPEPESQVHLHRTVSGGAAQSGERYRGAPRLNINPDNGETLCISCNLCALACPET
jgi:ferredoxin